MLRNRRLASGQRLRAPRRFVGRRVHAACTRSMHTDPISLRSIRISPFTTHGAPIICFISAPSSLCLVSQRIRRMPGLTPRSSGKSQERTLCPPESLANHIRVRSPYRLWKRRANFAAPLPCPVGSGCRIHNVRSAVNMHPRGLALDLSRDGLCAYLAIGSVRHGESARVLLCKSLHAFILGRFRFGRVRARQLRFILS